ncbi:PKD domain-containing protein [Hymenobacter gelipurpurascens]|uniref:PKD domain-containing protein n=1 Tax=Hymenobacter gelipurpurascens TaxID=89968 RepID=A0A212T6W6_9BACT|nr:PKD domain-containing protein [Hymenobacter gelipurpurascens]SNC61534.1 PKD domain-containing protein [Hymenobacter gelipurpurascens]
MMHIWNKTALVLLASSLVFTACDKDDDGKLEGPKPTVSFVASAPKVVGLTSEVTFTSTSTDAFLYQWDFGDGTIGSGQTVTHVYTKGGTFKVQVVAAGRGGSSTSETKEVTIVSPLSTVNKLLTGGSSKTWMLDNTVDAPIVVGIEAEPTKYFGGVKAGELPKCQSDDEYTFSASNVFTYDSKGETFYANQKDYSCQPGLSDTSPLVFGAAVGNGLGQFSLTKAGTFIGATDASLTERVYRILSIDEKKMTLRAGSGASGGTVFTLKLVAK